MLLTSLLLLITVDRVHRLGQSRAVRAYRLVVAGSIEERLLKIQNHKMVTAKGSMAKLSKEEERRVKLTAMMDLFEITDDNAFYESDAESDDFSVNDSFGD